ncbi:MAG: sterol carrier family protein [Flaviflexus sp.]|nr:sterol carrier family protein [Flaviflexus sp.]
MSIDPVLGDRLAARLRAGEELSAAERRTLGRAALAELRALAPGRSTEVRIPYVGAVQVIAGPTHTRGTPPNTIEMSLDTWLALAVGIDTWAEALARGAIDASGTRADISRHLPLYTKATS